MTDEQKIAFIQTQVVCAQTTIEAMRATNQERISNDQAIAYGEEAFFQVQRDYLISQNAVIDFFNNNDETFIFSARKYN